MADKLNEQSLPNPSFVKPWARRDDIRLITDSRNILGLLSRPASWLAEETGSQPQSTTNSLQISQTQGNGAWVYAVGGGSEVVFVDTGGS